MLIMAKQGHIADHDMNGRAVDCFGVLNSLLQIRPKVYLASGNLILELKFYGKLV